MKRRSTDDHDRITEADVKAARVKWFKAFRLFLVNLPTIYKVIALVVALITGTIAAPEVAQKVSEIASGDKTIPDGQTAIPDPAAPSIVWQGQVDISLTSHKNAIDANSSGIKILREELLALEKRVASKRERGDNSVAAKVKENSKQIDILNGIVQP